LSQGKNIHFDEEERAKEEWTEVKVEEAAEAPKFFDPSRYVCNDCNKPFDPTSMYSIICTADSNPLHYRCHSCNFKRENYWDWRPE
jgi:DNA-directed RNA polymerase subunit RPC12/RpoP